MYDVRCGKRATKDSPPAISHREYVFFVLWCVWAAGFCGEIGFHCGRRVAIDTAVETYGTLLVSTLPISLYMSASWLHRLWRRTGFRPPFQIIITNRVASSSCKTGHSRVKPVLGKLWMNGIYRGAWGKKFSDFFLFFFVRNREYCFCLLYKHFLLCRVVTHKLKGVVFRSTLRNKLYYALTNGSYIYIAHLNGNS